MKGFHRGLFFLFSKKNPCFIFPSVVVFDHLCPALLLWFTVSVSALFCSSNPSDLTWLQFLVYSQKIGYGFIRQIWASSWRRIWHVNNNVKSEKIFDAGSKTSSWCFWRIFWHTWRVLLHIFDACLTCRKLVKHVKNDIWSIFWRVQVKVVFDVSRRYGL
jgi:hypothetical protein